MSISREQFPVPLLDPLAQLANRRVYLVTDTGVVPASKDDPNRLKPIDGGPDVKLATKTQVVVIKEG